jgi:hypothetical protein
MSRKPGRLGALVSQSDGAVWSDITATWYFSWQLRAALKILLSRHWEIYCRDAEKLTRAQQQKISSRDAEKSTFATLKNPLSRY